MKYFTAKKNKAREGSAFVNIAGVHEQQGDYSAALDACFLARDLLADGADPFVAIELYQTIGSIYGRMKKEKRRVQICTWLCGWPTSMVIATDG